MAAASADQVLPELDLADEVDLRLGALGDLRGHHSAARTLRQLARPVGLPRRLRVPAERTDIQAVHEGRIREAAACACILG